MLIYLALAIIIMYGTVSTMVIIKDNELALQKIKYEKALEIANEKYQWKKNRLRVYTELVYNAKYGVAND